MEKLRNALLEYLEEKYGISTIVKECVKRVLEQLEKGSICIKIDGETEKTELKKSPAVGTCDEIRPLIFDGENLYIQKYFIYKKRIIEKIEELQSKEKLHIITGGPGTGKTTSLAEILKNKEGNIFLAAPTGKAALRMEESLAAKGIKLKAKTLHRLLGYKHLSVSFKHTKENPLEADIIAIDECSMVDLPMMSKLLSAVSNTCDLYLLGDKNQLASVEAGSVFADICEKFKNNKNVYTELSKQWRAEEAPGIVKLSKQILENSVEIFENENVFYYESNKLKDELLNRYKEFFAMKNIEDALNFLKKFQILCATKGGRNGTEFINEFMKKEKSKFIPIMITENNYDLNLFNGDVGIKDNESAYFYANENEIKTFSALTLPKYETAFAITIHKSQGSEYKSVAVVYPNRETESESTTILTGELLYTAITRAKKECLLFGSKEVLINSCKRKITRASGIF